MSELPSVPPVTPITGVVFDFHHTLVHAGDPREWLHTAWTATGRPGDPASAWGQDTADAAVAFLDRLWDHARTVDPHNERDLGTARHREVYDRTIAGAPGVDAELTDALYAVMHDQWAPYDDAVPVLEALRDNETRVVLLSNVGYDLSPVLEHTGLAGLFDGVVMSYEVGVVKPAPAIFQRALDLLDRPAAEVLMVGDSWQDDSAAAALGIRTVILPRTDDAAHGLGLALAMVLATTRR